VDSTGREKGRYSASDYTVGLFEEPISPLGTAILLNVFNRPEQTSKVFQSIRGAKPTRLYVAGDGPRSDKVGEDALCERVREIATNADWPCEVKTLFRDENLGCKQAVSGAISWFFKQEEEGIILEDDCLPGQDFFSFCAEMLSHYRDDERIWMITGNNFQSGMSWGEGSYYFSRYPHIWGWACWRSAWEHFDGEMTFWPRWRRSPRWRNLFHSSRERRHWQRAFNRTYNRKIDSWAYPWMASIWHGEGLTVTPNKNLVSNIGFGLDATHTLDPDSKMNIATERLGNIVHARAVSLCKEADANLYEALYREKLVTLIFRLPKILARYISMVVTGRRST
jgi:hypothetical protein